MRSILSLLLLSLTVGCATARNITRTSELTGCKEPFIEEISYQQADTAPAAEAAPELGWYRGCGRTLACVSGSEPECFDAAEPRAGAKPMLVERAGGTLQLREREEYVLPGLSHEDTVSYMVFRADRERHVGASDPGDSNCNLLGGGWGAGGGAGFIILLPVLAVVGTASLICAAEHGSRARDYERLVEDTRAIAAYEKRLKPSGPRRTCTTRDLVELRRAGVGEPSIAELCVPPRPGNIDLPRSAPAPVVEAPAACETAAQCRELAHTPDRSPDDVRALLVRACELGDATACEEGARFAALQGRLLLAQMMRQHALALADSSDGERPAAPWVQP
jgi:hypothetical protein